MAHGGERRAVLAALGANLGIAVAKFLGFLVDQPPSKILGFWIGKPGQRRCPLSKKRHEFSNHVHLLNHATSFSCTREGALRVSVVQPSSMMSTRRSNSLPFALVAALTASLNFVLATVIAWTNCS